MRRIFSVFATCLLVFFSAGVWAAGTGDNPPVAVNDTAGSMGRVAAYVDVLANDTEPDGEALTVTLATGAACPGATLTVDGHLIRVQPTGDTDVACSFGYRITDESNRTATAQVTIVQLALFADDFESGNPFRWSSIDPPN